MTDQASALRTDEHVVVFTTAARLSEDGSHWLLPVHAWVSRSSDSVVRLGLMERALTAMTGREIDAATRANFTHRANLLIADNKRNRRLVVRIGDHIFDLPRTAPNGHTSDVARLPAGSLDRFSPDGRLPVEVILPDGDPRRFSGEVLLLPPEGMSVISDIDDTVKVTHVTDRSRMLAATFLDDFTAVPGMAEAYRGWTNGGASLHFISSSPWHLYQPLAAFLQTSGFPRSTMTLKNVRLKDRSFFDLFRPGSRTKPPRLRSLVKRYPRRQFVLVGDSGEEDPEVYTDLMHEFPRQIRAIFIRNVTSASAGGARFRGLSRHIDARRFQLFDDAAELPSRLAQHGN
jgi:hypothetical protein